MIFTITEFSILGECDPRSDYLIGLAGLLIILSVMLIVRIRKKERAQRERLREEDYNA